MITSLRSILQRWRKRAQFGMADRRRRHPRRRRSGSQRRWSLIPRCRRCASRPIRDETQTFHSNRPQHRCRSERFSTTSTRGFLVSVRGTRTRDGSGELRSRCFLAENGRRQVEATLFVVDFGWDVGRLSTFRVKFIVDLFTNEFWKSVS